MLDLDVPDQENSTFTTYLHWLVYVSLPLVPHVTFLVETHTFLRPNISLSALSTSMHTPAQGQNVNATYIPPHPQKGTPYHRYVLALLPNPDPHKTVNLPRYAVPERSVWEAAGKAKGMVEEPKAVATRINEGATSNVEVDVRERVGFDMRAFCTEFGFDMAQGGGAHMWREVWSERVSDIYHNMLSECFLSSSSIDACLGVN